MTFSHAHHIVALPLIGMFTAAASSGKRELVVRRDALSPEAASALEDGSDTSLFTVRSLNHLQVSGFCSLPSLSPGLAHLTSLLQLSLTDNHLQSLPDEIGKLEQLRLLDASRNSLTLLPASLYRLSSLQTLLLAHNSLSDDSFPAVTEGMGSILPSLHHLDLASNHLTRFPSFLPHTLGLAELKASHNSLSSLDSVVGRMASLRLLELHSNQLTALPHELARCSKLKSLLLEDNPLQDRRLLKLVAQHGAHKPKAVLDYIASRAPQPAQPAGKKGKGKGKGKEVPAVLAVSEDSDEDVEFSEQASVLRVVRPDSGAGVEVVATSTARKVRPYLVCAVVRGVRWDSGEALRDFITLQTRLHDGLCKRRRAATIATHDLQTIAPPITYECGAAPEINFQPLGWKEKTTVQRFLDHVQANKPDRSAGKKAKSVDTAAAVLNKYLHFVQAEQMVYLRDDSGTVLSLPPLTNCDSSKVEEGTRDIFLEVTSAENLATAKSVMDALVLGMVGCVGSEGGMCVEQVRVVDEAGQLLVLYPSRTDLTATELDVQRPS